jgi:uncharacterized membrane protein YphA (DoxX/SURF4 family)
MKTAHFTDRRPATIIRFIIGSLLLLSLAAVFLWSGWTKIQSLEPFTWSFIDILPLGMTGAGILARIMIGLEWLIGGWLIAQVYSGITYRSTIAVLLLFCAYLGLLIYQQGNTGNCGCFGEWAYMKPMAAIWKNLIMIAALLLAWWVHPYNGYKGQMYPAVLLAVAAMTAPFLIEPVYISASSKPVREPMELTPLYDGLAQPVPKVDLRKGKHVVCYFSTTCPHCKKGAYLLQILHRRYPELPVYMVLNGNDTLEHEFLEETKSATVPHSLMRSTPAFSKMAGPYVPTILWLNNSVAERKTYYTELEPGAIKEWLKAK